jgi:8-oxo-dGTP pyrophosphatase MutT (NUDIX family)
MKSKKKAEKPQTKKSEPTQSLLQRLAKRPETLFNGSFRQQTAALCFRYKSGGPEIEVLVVTSRGSRSWIIPKGWPVKKKTLAQSAAIEAWEEAGVRGKVLERAIGRYTYLKELDGGEVVPCIVDVFQIEVDTVHDRFKELGQRVIAWVSPVEAARRVREIELKSLLIDFRPRAAQ